MTVVTFGISSHKSSLLSGKESVISSGEQKRLFKVVSELFFPNQEIKMGLALL